MSTLDEQVPKEVAVSADSILAATAKLGTRAADSPPTSFRMLLISLLSAAIGLVSGILAFALYKVIGVFTNLFFFHRWSADFAGAQHNHLGWMVIVTPVIGGNRDRYWRSIRAEGPIIQTGGATGSLVGQAFHAMERRKSQLADGKGFDSRTSRQKPLKSACFATKMLPKHLLPICNQTGFGPRADRGGQPFFYS
jgi:hypothetical protein